MDNIDGLLIVHKDIEWKSWSTALITAYAGIRTYCRDLEIALWKLHVQLIIWGLGHPRMRTRAHALV